MLLCRKMVRNDLIGASLGHVVRVAGFGLLGTNWMQEPWKCFKAYTSEKKLPGIAEAALAPSGQSRRKTASCLPSRKGAL
jgi:hypothetical protein